jgi:D-tyrosyl-tRNA(Tyr) deacylase
MRTDLRASQAKWIIIFQQRKKETSKMKAILQRVQHASVSVDDQVVSEIGHGLVILLGIAHDDTPAHAEALAAKIAMLRIFEDAEGKMNLSCLDVQGEAIVVSQFTLLADTRRGRRPSFVAAARPEVAEPLCEHFIQSLRNASVPTQSGVFGAHMLVNIENDGPVTIVLDYPTE